MTLLELERESLLSRYEGWREFAEAPTEEQPDVLSREDIQSLSNSARDEYNERRAIHHANILIRTPQVVNAHNHLWDLLESNLQRGDRVKGAAAIDSAPSLGKSTTANAFGRAFHQRQISRYGEFLDDGETLHVPVCRVGFSGRMTIKGLNQKILDFYAHPSAESRYRRSSSEQMFASQAAETVVRHRTRLIIVDDIHFLKPLSNDGAQVANQLKWLANEYPVTFLFTGVRLIDHGLLDEGTGILEMAQTARRWTLLSVPAFTLENDSGRAQWELFIKSVESRLVLADAHRGMLVNLAEYLYARSSGMIGSLMQLVSRGAARAVRTGAETLSRDLLDDIQIDMAAEAQRAEIEAELAQRRQNRRRK